MKQRYIKYDIYEMKITWKVNSEKRREILIYYNEFGKNSFS